jgi:hypothetical protein
MNCLQALAVAAATLVASGSPLAEPLLDAPAFIERQTARGEALLRDAAAKLEARLQREDESDQGYARTWLRSPDGHIHAARLL